ncbi:MAG: ABC transporter permease [Spirochaetia bacterium]
MKARLVVFLSTRMLRGKAGTARYLRGAVLGIAVSLVPLLVVMEVSTGMIEGITARLLEVGTYHLQVPLAPDIPGRGLASVAAAIAKVPEVVAAVPERIGTAMIVSAGGASGASIRFVPPDLFSRDKGFRAFVSIREGDDRLDRPNSLLVSSAMAASLGVRAGDMVSVLTTWEENLSGPPKLTPVRVSGVYDTGYQELDATLAYAPLALADHVLSPRAARAMIGVKVRDPFGDLTQVARNIARAAGGDARVATWREIEYARLSSFRTTKALLLFIMALIVVVACVNVSSSVLMILFERRHDLGILKSVGASPRALSLSFLLAGFATGLAGTVMGIAAGLLVAVNINEVIAGLEWTISGVLNAASILWSTLSPSARPFGAFTLFNSAYYLKAIPVRIAANEVIGAAAAALVLSALAAYLPAARAARTRPLDILRKV